MATIKFTQALKRFYPSLETMDIAGKQVADILKEVETQYPGITAYLLDDQGRLRKHVNIFVNGEMIKDREEQSDQLTPDCEVYIMQALSGG